MIVIVCKYAIIWSYCVGAVGQVFCYLSGVIKLYIWYCAYLFPVVDISFHRIYDEEKFQ